jgi:tripartite-type tricarboxylate transporter receptor subunit TctC
MKVLGNGLVLLLVMASAAWSQGYPSKPIRYLVGGSAGSGTDTIGRIVAEGMTQGFGRQVLVENRPGGGSNIVAELVAKAPPDGYTLLQATISQTVNMTLYKNLNYSITRDFAPVTLLANGPSMLVVHPSLPVKSVRELVKLSKSRPGAIAYASGGTGTFTFLAGELFKGQAGIDLLHVPYRGGGYALNAVVAGEAPVYFSPMAPALPLVRDQKLRPLAVTTLTRVSLVPELPTISESGLPGYQSGNWYGLLVPVKTPDEVVAAIRSAAITALKHPVLNKRLLDLGYIVGGNEPQEFAAFIQSEIAHQAKIVRALKLSAD